MKMQRWRCSGVGAISLFSLNVFVCLKIMKPKDKRERVGEKKDWSEHVMTFVFVKQKSKLTL